MLDSDEIGYNTICRSCLISTEDMKSLFDLYSTEMSVMDVFCAITLLQCAGDNNKLPSRICNDCFYELKQSYKFVLKCRKSDHKLRNHLAKYIKARDGISVTQTNPDHVSNLSSANLFTEVVSDNENRIKLEGNNESFSDGVRFEFINTPTIVYEMHTVIDENIEIVKHELDIGVKTETVNLINEVENESINAQMLETQKHSVNQTKSLITGSEINDAMKLHKSLKNKNNLEAFDINELSIDELIPKTVETFNKQQGIKENVIQVSSTRNLTKRKRTLKEKKSFTCEECDKSFDRKINLIIHIRLHTSEESHNNNSHLQLHGGNKPYSCTVCNKSFYFRSHQTRHMRIHSGERPYLCTVCHKSFGQSYYLIEHMRIHNEEKPFSCTVCDKSFYNETNRTRHMRIHNGETPYSCMVCNKSYRWQSGLKIHMRLHK